MKNGSTVVLVTKDVNLRMKAKALGIHSEDYTTDRVSSIEDLYSGKAIIENFSFDTKQIYSFIKKHVKGNVSNYLQEYMILINEVNNIENKQEIKKYLQIFKKLL